jgi:phosphatidate cytidylyltransferase
VLKTRVITAVILGPLVLAAIIFLSPQYFAIFSAVVLALGAWEWGDLSGLPARSRIFFSGAVLLAFQAMWDFDAEVQRSLLHAAVVLWGIIFWWLKSYPASAATWGSSPKRTFLGLFILCFAWLSLNLLKQDENGVFLILLLLAMVWSADIGAYFSGRKWGDRKLAPHVSPGKTWAGVYGALVVTVAVTFLILFFSGYIAPEDGSGWFMFALLAVFITVVSIVGDLAESMVKRHRGVKDSGKLLPGHGGIMDRVDSLVAALPLYTIALIQMGHL